MSEAGPNRTFVIAYKGLSSTPTVTGTWFTIHLARTRLVPLRAWAVQAGTSSALATLNIRGTGGPTTYWATGDILWFASATNQHRLLASATAIARSVLPTESLQVELFRSSSSIPVVAMNVFVEVAIVD